MRLCFIIKKGGTNILGDIDRKLKPVQPQYFLCKPDKTVITKLPEVFNDNIIRKFSDVDELSFSLPYKIDINHVLKDNPHIENMRQRYLIKVVHNKKTEWFFIDSTEDAISMGSDILNINCLSTTQQLSDKIIKEYEKTAVGADIVFNDALNFTTWTLDYMDADFKLSKRQFEFRKNTVLDVLFSVAEKYNAVLVFDTDKETVNMSKPELTGNNRGFTVNYGKLMNGMNRNISSTEMVTRLYAYGSDGLTFQKVNPTGKNYIENYSYWMFPFQRDSNKTVLSSSYYMSDSLCHAILDYEALIEQYRGQFELYLNQLEDYETEYSNLFVELNKLKNDQAVLQQVEIAQQFDQRMFYEKFQQTGGTTERKYAIKQNLHYAVLAYVQNNSGMIFNVNGASYPTVSGQWTYITKFTGFDQANTVVIGGSGEVFIQIVNITLDEYNSNNNSALVEKYSLKKKDNQVLLKEIELNNKDAQITAKEAQITQLQNILSAQNNFTPAQLRELNKYLKEADFSDDVYIDPKDLYKGAQEKFVELQQPVLDVSIDLVNFYEIVEEQLNWNKLYLGDFINIKYAPLGIKLTARVTEININFEDSSIGLTLSNAKDVNDESKRIEKFLKETSDRNTTVDTSKKRWESAVTDSGYFNDLFEKFYDQITGDINMSINNTVQIDNRGMTVYTPDNPNSFIRITHGQIGITRSGGLRYETALDAYGIIAETVYGKIILGQRVVVGDDKGLFVIEDATLTITDRYEREVAKLGLLQENPDLFGFTLNRYATPRATDTTIINTVNITADDGFYIERIRNGIRTKTFGTSLDGDLYIKAGDGNEVFTINSQGLAMGAANWIDAPFRADYLGNVWMNKLFADSAEIKNSLFKDGLIEGSRIELRNGGGVMILDPLYGFWAGAENFEEAIASIAMDGTAKFKKLIVTDGEGSLLIDSENRVIDMGGMDLIGAGAIQTDLLSANFVTGEYGNITDLTAARLSTMTNAALTGYTNYINIVGNEFAFISGRVTGSSPKTLEDGRPLYWVSSTKTGRMTTDVTPNPVLSYTMEEKKKLSLLFSGSGEAAYPILTFGEGSGTGNSIGYIRKPATSFEFEYVDNFGSKKHLLFNDNILEIDAARKNIKISQSDQGSTIEIKDDGSISISNSNNVSSIVMSPTGVITIKGSRINLDA